MSHKESPDCQISGSGSPKLAVKLSLAGSVELCLNGDKILQGKRKALALTAYLALAKPGAVAREHLAALLWGNSTDKQSMGSLRQTISVMQKAMGDLSDAFWTVEWDSVTLNHATMQVDVLELIAELEARRVPDSLNAQPRLLSQFMLGYDDLGEEFASWLGDARIRYQNLLARALEKNYSDPSLSEQHRIQCARIALQIDDLNEKACRWIMRLSAQAGDTATALSAYNKLFSVMEEELDVEPSASTQQLYVEIKTGKFRGDPEADGVEGETSVHSQIQIIAPRIDIPSVAVLPFVSLGPDPVPEFFSRGLAEDTVCQLATLREPRVISSNSSSLIPDDREQRREKIRQLGADYAVAGSVRLSGGNYHLSVQLYHVQSEVVEWAQVFRANESNLFDVQLDIANNIALCLVPSLRIAELRRTQASRPQDLSAYHLTLKARDMAFRLDRESFEEAGKMLLMACDKDGQFAPSHVAAADWFSVRLGQGWSSDSREDQKMLEHYARRAVELNQDHGRALAMLAHNQTIQMRKYKEAQLLFERAIDASPNDAETLMWSSPTLAFTGKHEESINRAAQAIALSPNDPYLFRFEHFLSIAYYSAGQYEEAARWGLSSHGRNPKYTSNLRMTTASLAACGRKSEAFGFALQLKELDPAYSVKRYLNHHPYQSDAIAERYAGHLLASGVQE